MINPIERKPPVSKIDIEEIPTQEKNSELVKYLSEYLEIENLEVFDEFKLIKAEDLPAEYKEQYDFIEDENLGDVFILLVPDNNWHKGESPSESHVERDLILFNQDYFINGDDVAWMAHELAHCSLFNKNKDEYNRLIGSKAFDDIEDESLYPNNMVEKDTFTKQFEYLKGKGVDQESIKDKLEELYSEEDMEILGRFLNEVFSS